MDNRLENIVRGKRVLFITTHRIDYIRNTQEIEIIKKNADSLNLLYGTHNNHLLSALKILPKVIFSSLKDYDVIFVSYMCQLVVPFINWKIKGRILIVDFFISLYDSMDYDRQKFREDSIGARISHGLDVNSLKKADLVIADTRAHASYFAEEFSAPADKMEILYLVADQEVYYPRPQKKPDMWKDKYLVIYFETVIPLQGIDIILDAIRLLEDDESIHFLMVGSAAKLYDRSKTSNVTYIDWLSQPELAERIAESDLCLAGHFNGHIQKANRTIPGKAYIYESMGKTMILGNSIANHELFEEDERHIFVEMGNAKKLANAIKTVQNSDRQTDRQIRIIILKFMACQTMSTIKKCA